MRSLHDFRRLFDRQTGKKPQFNNAGLVWIDLFETVQNIVQRQQIGVRLRAKSGLNVSERDAKTIPTALCRMVRPRMVHQNASH